MAENLEVKLPSRKRIKWPADRQLAKMVAEKPMTVVARELDVSDVAVRKPVFVAHSHAHTPSLRTGSG